MYVHVLRARIGLEAAAAVSTWKLVPRLVIRAARYQQKLLASRPSAKPPQHEELCSASSFILWLTARKLSSSFQGIHSAQETIHLPTVWNWTLEVHEVKQIATRTEHNHCIPRNLRIFTFRHIVDNFCSVPAIQLRCHSVNAIRSFIWSLEGKYKYT